MRGPSRGLRQARFAGYSVLSPWLGPKVAVPSVGVGVPGDVFGLSVRLSERLLVPLGDALIRLAFLAAANTAMP